ncbi:sulfite reductase, subunit A [Desulfosporosinus acidiphilus SJ4]|uniref:Sulfite reductase, subunit A n=1 Tax=Desulfosporosinus acidiphilus (strain DSM 22704 / JCM 16185 / SJ4) TaxID=646529 RepID=I4D0Z8_DESAJ|nr:anaerobic sulfite reductase subunit AsrA [Desulfosporosinus acidiphilus]AFM39472.1 sulfite reductase, subunit A [Desulfosporosinus acidiphilus SJ4]
MGFRYTAAAFNQLLESLRKNHRVYAPTLLKGKGKFSDTDLVGYAEVSNIEDVVFNQKSYYSPKETFYPMTQRLFYFNENEFTESVVDEKGIIVLLRACDIQAVERLDKIMLENGPSPDYYYERLRNKLKLIVMDCQEGFDSCFCVSMGANKTENYNASLRLENGFYLSDVKEDIEGLFASHGENVEVSPQFVERNKLVIQVPENLDLEKTAANPIWEEYGSRCIACGRCTVVCPSCSCYTMQDIFYEDNPKCGERRRVWASCHIDGFTDMAGGHSFRRNNGERMRFKVMHKIKDFKQRFGVPMCVGCGRCDNACPEYISLANCIHRLGKEEAESRG